MYSVRIQPLYDIDENILFEQFLWFFHSNILDFSWKNLFLLGLRSVFDKYLWQCFILITVLFPVNRYSHTIFHSRSHRQRSTHLDIHNHLGLKHISFTLHSERFSQYLISHMLSSTLKDKFSHCQTRIFSPLISYKVINFLCKPFPIWFDSCNIRTFPPTMKHFRYTTTSILFYLFWHWRFHAISFHVISSFVKYGLLISKILETFIRTNSGC